MPWQPLEGGVGSGLLAFSLPASAFLLGACRRDPCARKVLCCSDVLSVVATGAWLTVGAARRCGASGGWPGAGAAGASGFAFMAAAARASLSRGRRRTCAALAAAAWVWLALATVLLQWPADTCRHSSGGELEPEVMVRTAALDTVARVRDVVLAFLRETATKEANETSEEMTNNFILKRIRRSVRDQRDFKTSQRKNDQRSDTFHINVTSETSESNFIPNLTKIVSTSNTSKPSRNVLHILEAKTSILSSIKQFFMFGTSTSFGDEGITIQNRSTWKWKAVHLRRSKKSIYHILNRETFASLKKENNAEKGIQMEIIFPSRFIQSAHIKLSKIHSKLMETIQNLKFLLEKLLNIKFLFHFKILFEYLNDNDLKLIITNNWNSDSEVFILGYRNEVQGNSILSMGYQIMSISTLHKQFWNSTMDHHSKDICLFCTSLKRNKSRKNFCGIFRMLCGEIRSKQLHNLFAPYHQNTVSTAQNYWKDTPQITSVLKKRAPRDISRKSLSDQRIDITERRNQKSDFEESNEEMERIDSTLDDEEAMTTSSLPSPSVTDKLIEEEVGDKDVTVLDSEVSPGATLGGDLDTTSEETMNTMEMMNQDGNLPISDVNTAEILVGDGSISPTAGTQEGQENASDDLGISQTPYQEKESDGAYSPTEAENITRWPSLPTPATGCGCQQPRVSYISVACMLLLGHALPLVWALVQRCCWSSSQGRLQPLLSSMELLLWLPALAVGAATSLQLMPEGETSREITAVGLAGALLRVIAAVINGLRPLSTVDPNVCGVGDSEGGTACVTDVQNADIINPKVPKGSWVSCALTDVDEAGSVTKIGEVTPSTTGGSENKMEKIVTISIDSKSTTARQSSSDESLIDNARQLHHDKPTAQVAVPVSSSNNEADENKVISDSSDTKNLLPPIWEEEHSPRTTNNKNKNVGVLEAVFIVGKSDSHNNPGEVGSLQNRQCAPIIEELSNQERSYSKNLENVRNLLRSLMRLLNRTRKYNNEDMKVVQQ